MNFLDTYGIAGPSDVPENQSEHTLNEEVSEVMGHIGRFWGGFRKQARAPNYFHVPALSYKRGL